MRLMKNASTRALFAYWDETRADRAAPERGDIEPGAIRNVLADSFILAFDRTLDHPFRLAGTRVCAIFGRELRDQPFVRLFDTDHRADIRNLVTIVAEEANGIVAGAVANAADGQSVELELLLLPLAHATTNARVLGALAPIKAPFWLGRRPVETMTLGSLRYLDPQQRTATTRNPRFWTVYDGGRAVRGND
jgi:hypothetical protein